MKVLIISDTHGRDGNLLSILEEYRRYDFMVHLGDIGKLEDYIEEVTGLACFAVRGNNDWGSLLPHESVIMLGKHRTFITHGHQYGVYRSTDELRRHAEALGCDIVLYGHTHVPLIEERGGVTIVNPGSMTSPRGGFKNPSYVVADIDKDGDVRFEIKFVE